MLCDDGKLFKVIRYDNGSIIKMPINRDGSVRWFNDVKLLRK